MNKARGKSGPLFNFDVHEDIRLTTDASIEKDEVWQVTCMHTQTYTLCSPMAVSCSHMTVFCSHMTVFCSPTTVSCGHTTVSYSHMSVLYSHMTVLCSHMQVRLSCVAGMSVTNTSFLPVAGSRMTRRRNGRNTR